jgi:hypothetical protein
MTVSWSQLSRIPESTLKSSILRALDVIPDPRGRSLVFHDHPLYVSVSPGKDSYIVLEKLEGRLDSTCFIETSKEVIRAVRWPKGTPIGDALRDFLSFHDQYTLNRRDQ